MSPHNGRTKIAIATLFAGLSQPLGHLPPAGGLSVPPRQSGPGPTQRTGRGSPPPDTAPTVCSLPDVPLPGAGHRMDFPNQLIGSTDL